MKTIRLFILLFICLMTVSLVSCRTNTNNNTKTDTSVNAKSDNSNNSLDWEGIYTSVVPCADCEGIQTTIVLNNNKTYERRTRYIGKDDNEFVESGTFTWDDNGREITLSGDDKGNASTKFLVGENKITPLDMDGNRMEADVESKYVLAKVSDIVEKYWKLIELNGEPVAAAENQAREPHFILKIENNRVTGSGGCNTFNGTYTIENLNRIKFSQMATTMMACFDMEIESNFLKALEMADNYTVNGDTLSLNRARMAPLARFVVVYL